MKNRIKYIFYAVVVIAIFPLCVQASNSQSDKSANEKKALAIADDQVVAIIDGQKFVPDEPNFIINAYLFLDQSGDKEEIKQDIVKQELLREDAIVNGISVSDKELDEFISLQKQYFKEDEEFGQYFKEYLSFLELSEEAYWVVARETYRSQMVVARYEQERYKTFFKKKLDERLEQLGIVLNDEEYEQVFNKEIAMQNAEILSAFAEKNTEYERELISAHTIQYVSID